MAIFAGCESPSTTAAAPGPRERNVTQSGSPSGTPTGQNATETGTPAASAQPDGRDGRLAETVTIREGDILKISFPGAPMLDTSQQVKTDGTVTLDSVGEVKATGQTPKEFEKVLSKVYESQLVSNEVTVVIVSSSFEVYVTGAVLRPGKISATKPITAFQAIMEAGYDPINSDLKKITLIREVGRAKYTYISLNLQLVLEGKSTEPFYLKPSDTLQVPKKISIFQ